MKNRVNGLPELENMPEYLQISDIRNLFPVHLSTVYRMAERHELPVIRFGKRIIIEKKALLEWMNDEKTGTLNTRKCEE